MQHTPSGWLPLQHMLHNILYSHPEGMSEYTLFNQLKSPPFELFSNEALRDPLSLFQSHFILFNALYQLRDTWLQNKTGSIQIDCSCIRREPYKAGQNAVVLQDKLRAYYLDWTNLSDTDHKQVEALLDSFWHAFAGMPKQTQDNTMPQQQALDLFNLTTPFSQQQLKQQYRKMLHLHHPDKGGDNGQTVQLHNAYQQLKTNVQAE